jgi:hypothetical protein
VQGVERPRCWAICFFTERWKVKSNSSRVFRAGKRAAFDPVLPAVGLPRGDLGGEHRLQEALV